MDGTSHFIIISEPLASAVLHAQHDSEVTLLSNLIFLLVLHKWAADVFVKAIRGAAVCTELNRQRLMVTHLVLIMQLQRHYTPLEYLLTVITYRVLMTVSDVKSQLSTDAPKHELTSVPVWCRLHKLWMQPSSLRPASNFSILGDYPWELHCNSNKQLPLLFPSAGCGGCSTEGFCHVDVRTDWSRHLQLYHLHLSHLERHPYCFLEVVLMSGDWWLHTAFLYLSLLRLVF